MRIQAKTLPEDGYCLVHEYVWEWPVRLTHLLNGISSWVLSVTRISIA